jgi:lipid-binding SYLF domain-containing protein
MHPMLKIALSTLMVTALAVAPVQAQDGNREAEIVQKSLTVLTEMQAMPDLQVPDWLLQRAEGIAILPEVVKAGALLVGGGGGGGVLLVRHKDGTWSNPLFVGLAMGNFGPQFGIQAADVVLVFTTRKSIEGVTDGKITLGGDASAVAGPVGRTASASTSVTLDAEIYSYSRSQGLFAGVSLAGSVLFVRDGANERFYGKTGVIASDIVDTSAPMAPPPGPELIQEVTRITAAPAESPGTPAATAPQEATEAAPATPATAPADAQTYPMADPNPGAEPK